MINISIGQRIKHAREKQKLSQEELGDLMGVSFQSVQQWESGKTTPRTTRMRKLATVLKISPIWIQFGYESFNNENSYNALDFVGSNEFKTKICLAYEKTLLSLMVMGWIENKRKEIPMSIINDIFFSKLIDELNKTD